MRVVSWNMNRLNRSEGGHNEAWDYLQHELKADIVLAQEAAPPPRLAERVYQPIGKRPYNWGSAVVALRAGLALQARPRIPLEQSLSDAVPVGALPDSHPGSCAVADVLANGRLIFTAISLYGSWEMMPGGKSMYGGPRLHRMLSDLTGALVPGRGKAVVLAGDFNVTSQGAESPENEAAAVFHRLRAWRLVDCIAHTRNSRSRSVGCECPDEPCSHVKTFRSGSQLDYAFASDFMVPGLRGCTVEGTGTAWGQSDHCPIILDFDEPALFG